MEPTPEDVVAALGERVGTACLDGGGQGWSIVVFDPNEIVTDGRDWPAAGRELTGKAPAEGDAPFVGGCLGFLGYGAGHHVAPVPTDGDVPEGELFLGRYEGALCYNHAEASWRLVGTASFRAKGLAVLLRSQRLASPRPASRPTAVRTMAQATWEAGIHEVKAYISAGDCYQINLTRAVSVEGVGDRFEAWRRLSRLANAAYGGFLRLPNDVQLLSSSPELLLSGDSACVTSIPIKGTRPRHPDPVVDRAQANELRESEKDKAELTMIVDLVRNDLGRIAKIGGVRWEPRRITAHANVHHASQRITADLAAGEDLWSALAAVFPAGSVTGAPKIRACQRIHALEQAPRGVYCGSIGYTSAHGPAAWNVAIRTAVATPSHGGSVRYHVGGGIVADSDAAAEWRETVHKGTVMARAFTGVPEPERQWFDRPRPGPRAGAEEAG